MENQGNITACPCCGTKLDKIPGRKKECLACKNFMYVRTSPQTGEKIVLSEEGAKKVDKEWTIKRILNGYKDELKSEFGVTDRDYERCRNDLMNQFGKEPSERDTTWAIFNQLLSKKMGNFHAMQMIYYKMAWFLNDEKRDFTVILGLVAKMQLMDYKKSSIVKKVSIIPCGNSCDPCKGQNDKKIRIDVALEEMPLPCKDCTNIVNGGVRGFCRCIYVPEV